MNERNVARICKMLFLLTMVVCITVSAIHFGRISVLAWLVLPAIVGIDLC